MPQDTPQRGDIFWADLSSKESRGSEQHGRRPVVVVSVNSINSSIPISVIVPLSRKLHKANNRHRILVRESEKVQEPGTGGCNEDSLALTEQIRCISRDRLDGTRVARLTP